jgi:hypothetical protein
MIQRKQDIKNMISHKNLKHDNYVYETWILKHCVWIALSNRFWNITSNENNPRCLWFPKNFIPLCETWK